MTDSLASYAPTGTSPVPDPGKEMLYSKPVKADLMLKAAKDALRREHTEAQKLRLKLQKSEQHCSSLSQEMDTLRQEKQLLLDKISELRQHYLQIAKYEEIPLAALQIINLF